MALDMSSDFCLYRGHLEILNSAIWSLIFVYFALVGFSNVSSIFKAFAVFLKSVLPVQHLVVNITWIDVLKVFGIQITIRFVHTQVLGELGNSKQFYRIIFPSSSISIIT